MANDISGNPWRIDTAGAGAVYAFPVKVMNIIWANYTLTSAQTLIIRDVNGKDIVNMSTPTTGGSGAQLTTGFLGWVRGIVVPTISSGEISISIGAGK